jgi:hypothetical protein
MTYYKSVGLIGHARAGKDTVAARMGQRFGFQRVAFADQLKRAALRVDPFVSGFASFCDEYDHDVELIRLSTLVESHGWDVAKDSYPEVRRFLQAFGQAMRELDPMIWVEAAMPAVHAAHDLHLPVVVTDVRHHNEARSLQARGFVLIRVTRPGTGLDGDAGKHRSETEMDDWPASLTIGNTGSLDDLNRIVDGLLLPHN